MEEVESKIDNEKKEFKHTKNKKAEEMEAERKHKKNMENIQKLNEMEIYRGKPAMKRVKKPKAKKKDVGKKYKDQRDEDFKRYVAMT